MRFKNWPILKKIDQPFLNLISRIVREKKSDTVALGSPRDIVTVVEFSFEQLHCNDSKNEHEKGVNNQNRSDVFKCVYNTHENR